MTPLYDRNVDAIWHTRRYLIFAVTAYYESVLPQFVWILCWQLDTGRWFTSPGRDILMHRPGFDLPALLPDWYSARAYESGTAIVLRGRDRALALWPDRGTWAHIDAANGRPILQRFRPAPRRLLSPAEIPPNLRGEIRDVLVSAHGKAKRDVIEFNLLELIRDPCASARTNYAVIARALGEDRMPGGPEMDWTRELFAVCILDSSLTHVARAFTPFPSERWRDYTAYFDLDAPGDSIAVWGEGDTYGDAGKRYAYPCGP